MLLGWPNLRIALAVAAVQACGHATPSVPPVSQEFQGPRRVAILGYQGSAMEPFISCDGRHLFFNSSNDPAAETDVFFAENVGTDSFRLVGAVPGANEPLVLDGVPSMDAQGTLFFTSTRSYATDLLTLYAGSFRDGGLVGVRPVLGSFARRKPGWLTMDAEVSRDGAWLYFSDARFAGGALPESSDLGVAQRQTDGSFTLLPDSEDLLRRVNTDALEYAPSTSSDGLELFFTRYDRSEVAVLRSTRANRSQPFGPPERLSALSGFVEAPSLSCDGTSLYYHRKDGAEFAVYRVTR